MKVPCILVSKVRRVGVLFPCSTSRVLLTDPHADCYESVRVMSSKTKKVAGVDLASSSFAYVGNPDDTSTWKLPLFFPGDQTKTVNHVKDALGRFEQTAIPDEHREMVRHTIAGAAKAHGLRVESTFIRPVNKTQSDEKLEKLVSTAELAIERDLKDLEAEFHDFRHSDAVADFKASAILKALGIE